MSFAIGQLVRTKSSRSFNLASDIKRHGYFVVLAASWIEPGEYIGDGTENRNPDWTCMPVVEQHISARAAVYGNTHGNVGIRAFVDYYGHGAKIMFADVSDLADDGGDGDD
jgi:hypothetical protein